MREPTDILSRIRVASPCSSSWDKMSGDDRVRFCDDCKLNVYDFSALTSREIERLVSNGGRVCGKLYRRADGKLLTRDCPVGVSAIRRRVARVAGAVFATILGTFVNASAQKKEDRDKSAPITPVSIERVKEDTQSDSRGARVSGQILDPWGAAVPGASITIVDKKNQVNLHAISDESGSFVFPFVGAGTYTLQFAASGFSEVKLKNVSINAKENLRATVQLTILTTGEVIGIIAYDPMIDTSSTEIKTVFKGDLLRRLPF